jgi:NADPH:quinone reductase
MKLIRVQEHGGPEVMKLEEGDRPTPGPGQALVKVEAAGVNFIDIYFRSGAYKSNLPLTPGQEGAGVVEAVGPDVTDVKEGDRVGWAGVIGSYAQYQVIPAARLVPIPEGVGSEDAAAVLLQGMTAHYLSHSTYAINQGDTCLVHAAAGGVGQLLCQMAKMRGARVFGTVGSREKADIAREAGADEVILYEEEDFTARARELTGGKGVQVVYDMVGKSTFEGSLNSLAVRGMMALVGQASGAVPPFDPQQLNAKGGLYLTRPSMPHYTQNRDELLWRANDVLGWVGEGKLKLRIEDRIPLAEAPRAHELLAGRRTAGKLLLMP